MALDLLAAVDLGSNSFRLQIGRVEGNQILSLDSIKEPVRLAAGLGLDKVLDKPAQKRGIAALERFRERLQGFDPAHVRAVATNTLRVARNAADFLQEAEEALGFPIEVIAGREEARLIFIGVEHSLPYPQRKRLVVDIGGGSTEFIIGQDFRPQLLESLYMGCVSYSLRYFPQRRITRKQMKEAELAASQELEAICYSYRQVGWEEAVGSSGTAKAIADVLEQNNLNPSGKNGITRVGLEALCDKMLTIGDCSKLTLKGLKQDRLLVLPGGVAIMGAVMRVLGIQEMIFSEGALRLGVLYDQLGRSQQIDLRDATVQSFMRRYEVDVQQVARVEKTALRILDEINPGLPFSELRYLQWAARLHEIGISVAHTGYHKHSAYILSNADMPGFSRSDQERLARLVLAHRGKLERVSGQIEKSEWLMIFALRIAALLHRSHDDRPETELHICLITKGFEVVLAKKWLEEAPLTWAALTEEADKWARLNFDFRLKMQKEESGNAK